MPDCRPGISIANSWEALHDQLRGGRRSGCIRVRQAEPARLPACAGRAIRLARSGIVRQTGESPWPCPSRISSFGASEEMVEVDRRSSSRLPPLEKLLHAGRIGEALMSEAIGRSTMTHRGSGPTLFGPPLVHGMTGLTLLEYGFAGLGIGAGKQLRDRNRGCCRCRRAITGMRAASCGDDGETFLLGQLRSGRCLPRRWTPTSRRKPYRAGRPPPMLTYGVHPQMLLRAAGRP